MNDLIVHESAITSVVVGEEMTIAALITTYNRAKPVQRAIDSIVAQTVPVDEIIVVDDGSTDGTADVIRSRYGSRVRVVWQENGGVSAARRRAVQEAKCDWVAFLDSDDEWVADRNGRFLEALKEVPPDVGWIFGDLRIVTDEDDSETLFHRHGLNLSGNLHVFEDSFSIHLPLQFCMMQASLIRKRALLEVDCFSEGLRHSEDFLAAMQVACRYRFAAVPDVVCLLYRTSDLRSTSLNTNFGSGPDYYRARIIGYGAAVESGRHHPWADLHAHAVQGLCKLRASQGYAIRKLAEEQFRYGTSAKSIAFYCAALFGRNGLRLWNGIGDVYRKLLHHLSKPSVKEPSALRLRKKVLVLAGRDQAKSDCE